MPYNLLDCIIISLFDFLEAFWIFWVIITNNHLNH